MPDRIRQNAEKIAGESAFVHIDGARVYELAKKLTALPEPEWDGATHFFDGTEKSLMYILVLDAVNYCFWPSRFAVEYKGVRYGDDSRYKALAVILKRALEEGVPLWDPEYLQRLTLEEFTEIMRAEGSVSLLFQRLQNVRDVGKTLLGKYGGDPMNILLRAGRHAPTLARELADNFMSYQDSRDWKGERVDFLKRAQLCAADIAGTFSGEGAGGLTGLDELTCFADYKLPQLFHAEGVFRYSPDLERRIMREEEIPENSREEVEIRANTIEAVERLKKALARFGRKMSSQEIDWMLWNESIQPGRLTVPHHKTLTSSY